MKEDKHRCMIGDAFDDAASELQKKVTSSKEVVSSMLNDFVNRRARGESPTSLQFNATSTNSDSVHLMIPAIVNRSFAVEQYLKALYFNENQETHTKNGRQIHKLDKIFFDLKPETQEIIRRKINLSENEFENEISKIATDFVEWRYLEHAMDGSNVARNTGFTTALAKALRDLCQSEICN